MNLMNGLLILLLCQCIGEALKAYFKLSLPGPVLGMLILFCGLLVVKHVPESVSRSSQVLITQLGLMFLPASVGLFVLGDQFDDQWPAILAAVVIGSILSLLFNALVMRWLVSRQQQSKSHA
jgi:holin-like protein